MGFFAVMSAGAGAAELIVKKLDVNVWLLPGLPGRRVIYCDVGLKLQVGDVPSSPNDRLKVHLGIPFQLAEDIEDLSRLFHDDKRTANLVFGNNDEAPRKSGRFYTYFDGEDEVALLEPDSQQSKIIARGIKRDGRKSAYSVLEVSSEQAVEANKIYYLRLRLVATDSGKTWSWQSVGWRRSFAIADLRVNEFRDQPSLDHPVSFELKSLDIERVNFFVVITSRLKEQRASKPPRYVRPLERRVWEPYLGRRLSKRNGETFLIYYWRQELVTPESPFRSFLEVERRRPTATPFALIAGAVSVVGFILVSPVSSFDQSVLAAVVGSGAALASTALALVSVGVLLALGRFVAMAIPHWKRVGQFLSWLETRRFRLPGK